MRVQFFEMVFRSSCYACFAMHDLLSCKACEIDTLLCGIKFHRRDESIWRCNFQYICINYNVINAHLKYANQNIHNKLLNPITIVFNIHIIISPILGCFHNFALILLILLWKII